MAEDLEFYIEWPAALPDLQVQSITAKLGTIDGATAELRTDRALGGLELVVNTIVLAMATHLGEKIVDALWGAVEAVLKAEPAPAEPITVRGIWQGGEVRLVLAPGDEAVLKQKLQAVAALVETPPGAS